VRLRRNVLRHAVVVVDVDVEMPAPRSNTMLMYVSWDNTWRGA